MAVSIEDLTDLIIEPGLEGGSPQLAGVLGVPQGAGPWSAVVVLHEIFGVEDQMRGQVAHLASLGYLAIMPDLYSAGGARRCLVATMRAMRSGRGRAYVDIESARLWAAARPDVTGPVGVIGFCMGGGFALMTAATGFGAAASNYGMLPTDMDAAFENSCPVVGSYGGRDRTLRGAATKLERALTDADVANDIKAYPSASHAFMNDRLAGPAWSRPIARVAGFGPDPDAAADAWQRIDEFFRRHLSEPATSA